MRLRQKVEILSITALLAAVGSPAFADLPTRVGRLSYLSGNVSFEAANARDWSAAAPNYPVATGDHVWTDADARAEVHVGRIAVRLAPYTAMDVLSLGENIVQLRVAQGAIDLRIRHLQVAENVEIDTPNAAVTILRSGSYRVNVNPDGATSALIVRRGEANITTATEDQSADAGDRVWIRGSGDATRVDVSAAPAEDAWDLWCDSRDRQEDDSASARYCSQDMEGYQILDSYGSWRQVPEYGIAWAPSETPAGWSPFHSGHWAWVSPWGWTWVDDAPWGFCPSHYGRWVWTESGWAWVPGSPEEPAAYAPAVVAFLSISESQGTSGPGVAWVPLAPGETYAPTSDMHPRRPGGDSGGRPSGVGPKAIRTAPVYANLRVPGAITSVSTETFASGRAVQAAVLPVSSQAVSHATIAHPSSAPPSRPGLILVSAPVAARPPAALASRPVFSKEAPPSSVAVTPAHEFSVPSSEAPAQVGRGGPQTTANAPSQAAPESSSNNISAPADGEPVSTSPASSSWTTTTIQGAPSSMTGPSTASAHPASSARQESAPRAAAQTAPQASAPETRSAAPAAPQAKAPEPAAKAAPAQPAPQQAPAETKPAEPSSSQKTDNANR